jgi:hypothetical protein
MESQLKTLLHKSCHAGAKDRTENISYGYAEEALQDMKCCLLEAERLSMNDTFIRSILEEGEVLYE